MKKIKIEKSRQDVKKIILWHSDDQLTGIQLFDAKDVKLLESSYKLSFLHHEKHEIILEEGERIVGMKSRKYNDSFAFHLDF